MQHAFRQPASPTAEIRREMKRHGKMHIYMKALPE